LEAEKKLRNFSEPYFSFVKTSDKKRETKHGTIIQVKITQINEAAQKLKFLENQEISIKYGSNIRPLRTSYYRICNMSFTSKIYAEFYEPQQKFYFLLMDKWNNDLLEIISNPDHETRLNLAFIFFRQVLFVFTVLKNESIVYNDIRPENFIYDNDGHFKVSNFELIFKSNSSKKHIFDTDSFLNDNYHSPEKMAYLKGNGSLDFDPHKSDVFSLGLVILTIILGDINAFSHRSRKSIFFL